LAIGWATEVHENWQQVVNNRRECQRDDCERQPRRSEPEIKQAAAIVEIAAAIGFPTATSERLLKMNLATVQHEANSKVKEGYISLPPISEERSGFTLPNSEAERKQFYQITRDWLIEDCIRKGLPKVTVYKANVACFDDKAIVTHETLDKTRLLENGAIKLAGTFMFSRIHQDVFVQQSGIAEATFNNMRGGRVYPIPNESPVHRCHHILSDGEDAYLARLSPGYTPPEDQVLLFQDVLDGQDALKIDKIVRLNSYWRLPNSNTPYWVVSANTAALEFAAFLKQAGAVAFDQHGVSVGAVILAARQVDVPIFVLHSDKDCPSQVFFLFTDSFWRNPINWGRQDISNERDISEERPPQRWGIESSQHKKTLSPEKKKLREWYKFRLEIGGNPGICEYPCGETKTQGKSFSENKKNREHLGFAELKNFTKSQISEIPFESIQLLKALRPIGCDSDSLRRKKYSSFITYAKKNFNVTVSKEHVRTAFELLGIDCSKFLQVPDGWLP
jgi:hypothetical protein